MQEKTNKLDDLIRPEIKEMQAYHVPVATGLVKLDAMENPFPWPQHMKDEWLELISKAEPNRYPDPSASELVSALRECFKVDPESGLVLGNGSDELIQMILMAMKCDACVMAPTPSFVMYQHIARSLGLSFVGVPLNDDFSLNMSSMLADIEKFDPAVIFLAYPNNPTANLFSDEDVLSIIEATNGIVVIDEAYQPFAQKTFLNRVKQFEQVLVMRTVSKLGLAGLRLGFMTGHRSLTEQFEKIRLPYNINVFTQLTARFAFKHIDILDAQAVQICQERDSMSDELSKLGDIQVFPSEANFLLFALLRDSAERVFDALKESGVLIKKMGSVPGLPNNCLRVTVGSATENRLFLQRLASILN